MSRKLTYLQERFVNNLLSGMHQDEAYVVAGYKARGASARVNASRLLTNANIQAALENGRKKASDRAVITAERILREEARLAFFDIAGLVDKKGKLLPLHKLPEDVRRVIVCLEIIQQPKGALKYKYKFSDKGKSLERLSRHLGMYNDKLNLGFSSETLNAILSGLPDEYARAVRAALGELVSKK
jgi:phage terminase small subunit